MYNKLKSAVSLESFQQASFLQIRLSRRSWHSQQSPSQRNPGVVALLKSDGRQSPDIVEHRRKHQNSTSTDDIFGTKHRDHWSVCNDDPEHGRVVELLGILIKQGFEYCVFRNPKRFQLIESGKNYLLRVAKSPWFHVICWWAAASSGPVYGQQDKAQYFLQSLCWLGFILTQVVFSPDLPS